MTNNLDDSMYVTTEEYHRMILNEFPRYCFHLCLAILFNILKCPCHCVSLIKKRISKQYIAVIMLFLSFILLSVVICLIVILATTYNVIQFVTMEVCGKVLLYTVAWFICSFMSLCSQRGLAEYKIEDSEEEPEKRRLIRRDRRPRGRETFQPAQDKHGTLKRTFENIMEPRPGNEAAFTGTKPSKVLYHLHGSESFTHLYSSDDNYENAAAFGTNNSAGPSATADTTCGSKTNLVVFSHLEDSSSNSNEPPQHLPLARLAVGGIKTFGAPLLVLGADSYGVFLSSDEHISSDSSVGSAVKNKMFEVSAEVHAHLRISDSSNGDSNSFERAAKASEEKDLIAESDLPFMGDDQTSQSSDSAPLDDGSIKTENNC